MAMRVHAESADAMRYLSLRGLEALHGWQYFSEAAEQRRVKKYIIDNFHVILPDNMPQGANISVPLTESMPQQNIDEKTAKNALKTSLEIYQAWEADTLKIYSDIARRILDGGCVASYEFVAGIVRDVQAELAFLNAKITEYAAHDYDMAQISADQPGLAKIYEKKLKDVRFRA